MRFHRIIRVAAAALLISIMSNAYATARINSGGPVVRGAQLALQGPSAVHFGHSILLRVSIRNAGKSPLFVQYGSLELVRFHVTDANGRVIPQREIMGITLLPHPYLAAEDERSVVLQRYADIDRPGTYTVTAQLHVGFTNGGNVHSAVGAILSSNSISVTVLP